MRSTKLKQKIMAGILCAAMVFQSVPAEAVASETAETVQSYDNGDDNEAKGDLPKETDAAENSSVLPEIVEGDIPDGTKDVFETPDAGETTRTQETSDLPETAIATETSSTVETFDDVTRETNTTQETDAQEGGTEAAEVESGSSETTETDETEEINETEALEETGDTEETQEIMLLDEEWPDFKRLLSVMTEDKYYFYADGNNQVEEIFVKLEGCEVSASDILINFYIDDEETPIHSMKGEDRDKDKNQEYYVISLKNKNITEGSHKLAVELIDQKVGSATFGESLVKKDEIPFIIEKVDNVFTEVSKYYVSAGDDTIEVAFYDPEDDIKSVRITASNGDTVAQSTKKSKAAAQKEDPRYTGIGDGYVYSGDILYKTVWVLPTEKNALEIGKYDIRLTLENGTERMIADAVEVSAGAVVTKCVLGMDYDNTSGYVYLYIQGTGFDPSRLQYDFEDEQTGATLSATRDSYKQVQSGYIVKLIKGGAWNDAGKQIKVTISRRPGSGAGDIHFTQSVFDAELVSGIYYAEYNPVLNAVEAGVTTDLKQKAVKFSIVDSKENPTQIIDVTSRSLTESIVYLTPDGSLTKSQYYVKLEAGGKVYYKEFNMNQTAPSTNHWEAPSVISKNAERHEFYYYAVEAGISNDELKASIDGYSGEVAVYADDWAREDGAKGTRIQVWIPTQKLPLGQHTVRITRNGNAFTSRTFEIVASDYDKFVLESYSLSWIDDKTIQVYIRTPNCGETDDYHIKMTDSNDREVANLNAAVTDRYADSVFMNVTGLDKSSAFKDYYVLITHKKYGQPVKMEDLNQKYYGDEVKGEKTSIISNKGLPVLADNRVIGLNIQNLSLPAQLTIYETESTRIVKTITIPATAEGNYYYFTKELYDSLEVKERLYDMTLSDSEKKWGRSYPRINIGYKDETVKNDFDIQITSPTLYIDGAESGRSAVITITGNKQTPVFEISDEEIVELQAYVEPSEYTNPNKRRVVAKNTGTTVITVIADGVVKSISITVTRSATGILLNTSNRNMKVGDSFEAEAFVQPQSAEDPTQIVNFTSSDNNILYVRRLTNTTANVVALKAGTAVLRATLEGTTYTVAVTISITDSLPLYNKKEIKIKEVGTVCCIDNVDKTLSDCSLPEGWAWNDGDMSLSASDDLQYYWATYTEEGYQPFSARLPVAVAHITGINATGKMLINQGQKENYRITYEYAGADISAKKFRDRLNLSCNRISDTDIAVVESLDWDELVIAARENTEGGTTKFALALSIDNRTNEGVDMFTKELDIKVPLIACVNNVKVIPVRENGQKFDYIENDDLMEIDVNDVKAAKNKYSVQLKAIGAVNGVEAKNIKFNWKSSDTAVAAVAANKNGAMILTVKKAGYVEITAAADDEGKCEGVLKVNIMDYAPILETSSVTVNKYFDSGAEIILQEQNGNEISSVRVYEGDKVSSNFSVGRPADGISRLIIKENASVLDAVKKTVSKCKLEVWTDKGPFQYDLKVTTDVTKPSIKLKLKKKANLFYADTEAVYTVSSKHDITAIEDVGTQETGFHGVYDSRSSEIRFSAGGTLNSSTLSQFTASKSPCLTTTLKVTFAGYSQPQPVDVRIAVENKKPSLSVSGLTVCPGISSGIVNVVNTKTKEMIPINASAMTFGIVKPSNSPIGVEIRRDQSVSMTYAGTKSLSYTAEVSSTDWTQPANAKGKITYVKRPEKMSLALGKKSVILNMGTNIEVNGVHRIPVSVTGSNIAIKDITYDGTAKKLTDAGYLMYKFNPSDQSISLGLNEGKRGRIKAGSYKLNLYASVDISEQTVTIKKSVMTIKLTEASAAKVTLSSPKGRINLIDRQNTSVVYTPKIAGIDSAIKDVSVTNENEVNFTAVINKDNKVEVKARAGRSMSSNIFYPVTMTFTMENGYQIPSTVKIKPVNSLPKIAFTPAKCNLYRGNKNKYTVSMMLKNSTIDLENITSIKIDTDTNKKAGNFALANNLSKNGTVSFSLTGDRNKIKKGRYKIKCLVTFKDAAVNAKPAAVNMVITVK